MPFIVTKLGPGGRFVLPAEIRRALGLRVGDDVVFELEPDGSVRLWTRGRLIERAQELARPYRPADGHRVSDDLIAERRLEAEREARTPTGV